MAGVILILLGVFKLGAVIKFIPYPIIVGFTSGIAGQLERITLPNKDVDFLREKLLLMYANPLTNYLAATK